MPQPEVANLCLEDIWREDLLSKGWSIEAAERFQFCLAKGTAKSYSNAIGKLAGFCDNHGHMFPPENTAALAEFLRLIADGSDRPNSVLRTALAALGHLYSVKGNRHLIESPEIRLLVTALVKSGTVAPMRRSKVMPVQAFHDLFMKWPSNDILDVRCLRLKAITLLALTLMLRPSDIAPKAQIAGANQVQQVCFSVDQVEFRESDAKITFFGIKNDTSRTGFEVLLPRADQLQLDPVSTLECYIQRTSDHRPSGGPVFLSLRAPFVALQASSVAKILEESIKLAGLGERGYSAKSFRPTGATSAIESNINPEIVRKVGRWKDSEVFFAHYVHARTPDEFTDVVLNHS